MINKIKWILGLIAFKLAPIKKNRIVFQSYHGHYSDSPRFISEYIRKQTNDYEQIWILSEENLASIPSNIHYVISGSLKSKWIEGSAKVIVDNVYCDKEYSVYSDIPYSYYLARINCFFKSKRGQLAFTTFHGTPFKTQDRDTVNSTNVDFLCPGTEMILGNQFAIDIYKHITFNKLVMHLLGSPRNDNLFKAESKIQSRELLNLDQERKYLLYAPTFRNTGRDTAGRNVNRSGLEQLEQIDFKVLFTTLNEKFGGEWSVILRFHQYVSNMINWKELNQKYEGRFINGNLHDEMADYLAAVDILMTDYSSSAFDFSLTGRLCLIYANDLDYFISNERGLYIPLEKLPFPYATDFDGLIKVIQEYEPTRYTNEIKKMQREFGYVDDVESTKRVAEYILKRAKE